MGLYPDKAANPAYYLVDDDGSPITVKPRWFGRGLGRIGLRARMAVSTVALAHLLNGSDAAGKPIANPTQTKGGHDWVHAPVKSVSIAHGLSGPWVRAYTEWAVFQATKQALTFIQDEILRTRKTVDGKQHLVRVEGTSSALILHRLNRDGFPQLHIHAVTAKSVYWPDARDGGKWMSIHSGGLKFVFKSAGAVFDCVLRFHLSQLFGARWVQGKSEDNLITYELAGYGQGLIRAFSSRRRAILAATGHFPRATWKIGRIAAWQTRQSKEQARKSASQVDWASIASRHGLTPGAMPQVFSRRVISRYRKIGIFRELISPVGLTEHKSIFHRHDAFRAIADRIPSGASYGDLRMLVHDFLSLREVVCLGRDDRGELIYTIRSLLEIERGALRDIEKIKDSDLSVNRWVLASVPGFTHLSDDHAAAVEHAVCCPGGVVAMLGYAGTGKTSDCRIVAEAFRLAGRRVIGTAPTADASRELGQRGAIRTFTLAKLLLLLREEDRLKKEPLASRRGYPLGPLTENDLIILDECSMAGTRELAELLLFVRKAGCRLLLVGDPAQLPPVPAGGLLSPILQSVGAQVLTQNKRQGQDSIDLEIVEALRTGQADKALGLMERHERVHFFETIAERREAQVNACFKARQASPGGPVVMISATNEDNTELIRLMRARLIAKGLLGSEALQVGERDFRVRDEVIFLKNPTGVWRIFQRPLHGVSNGTRGVVAGFVPDPRTGKPTISVRLQIGGLRTVPLRYLEAGLVDHAYATTGFKVQGRSFRWSGLAGTWALSRELAYVALSRGHDENHLFFSREDLSDDEKLDDQSLRRRLVGLLGRSRQKVLASSFLMGFGQPGVPEVGSPGLVPECARCSEGQGPVKLSLSTTPPARVVPRTDRPNLPSGGITGNPGLPRPGLGPL